MEAGTDLWLRRSGSRGEQRGRKPGQTAPSSTTNALVTWIAQPTSPIISMDGAPLPCSAAISTTTIAGQWPPQQSLVILESIEAPLLTRKL